MAVSINQNLNVLSWNATGIMSSSTYLCDTLVQRNIDICGISEHWLYEKDLHFFDEMDSNYRSDAVSDVSLNFPGRRRVGKGGVAILWHQKHDQNIVPLYIDDDRIIGIKYNCMSNCVIYFFQMYLPCSNYSLLTYTEYLDKIRNIMNLYSESGIVQVRFIIFIHMQFFHKSLHTSKCIATSAARYLMSKILTNTTTINIQSLLKLPVKAIAESYRTTEILWYTELTLNIKVYAELH